MSAPRVQSSDTGESGRFDYQHSFLLQSCALSYRADPYILVAVGTSAPLGS